MEKKYELILSDKEGLFRIKALKDFSDVTKGDIGGFVSGEHNLSHDGDCWIYNNAGVSDNAIVSNNAKIYGDARVYGSAQVSGDARVYGYAQVYDNAKIYENAKIYDRALVYGSAQVFDYARVYNDAQVFGSAMVYDDARVFSSACIYSGNIQSTTDYMLIGPIGSRDGFTTFFKDKDKIMVSCGCFEGTIKEFKQKVKETHQNDKYAKQYLDAANYVKKYLK